MWNVGSALDRLPSLPCTANGRLPISGSYKSTCKYYIGLSCMQGSKSRVAWPIRLQHDYVTIAQFIRWDVNPIVEIWHNTRYIGIVGRQIRTHRCYICSGKPPRYDKPSLKMEWTVKDVSATSARRRQVTPNYSVSLEGSTSVCPLFKDQERVHSEV